ncbi:MAG: hypothetical protein P4L49_13635 [Desulfosporosinus sp.]|nr:hypothetical protein [Desulfosporosinus sp.]
MKRNTYSVFQKGKVLQDPFPRDTFVKNRIVRDGNILTALPIALIDFAFEIGDLLGLFRNTPRTEEKIQMLKSYKQD